MTREDFLAEAEAGWEAFLHDGLHLTGEEVDAWLAGWGTENETVLPACHE